MYIKSTVITIKKILPITALLSLSFLSVTASDTLYVKKFTKEDSYTIQKPFLTDSVNNQQQKFSDDKTLFGEVITRTFSFSTKSYINAEVLVKKAKESSDSPIKSKVYINDVEFNGKKGFQPGQYDVKVRYVKDTANVTISLVSDKDKAAALVERGTKRPFNPGRQHAHVFL